MNPLGDRRGMTLVELVLVAVLGTVVLAALFQVLISNQRTYAAQNAMIQDQQSLRAGAEVLFSELREISPADGDLIDMGSAAIAVRSSRALGLVCSIVSPGQNPVVQARAEGRFLRGDSARVFYENDPSLLGDDDWRTALIAVVDSTGLLTCPDGRTAQTVRLRGLRYGSLADADSITPGAPIRNFNHFTYALRTWDGEPYLVRVDESGAVAPLVGPLRADNGVEFTYMDQDGNVTATAANVRQIRVTLRTSADYVDRDGAPLQDSIRVRIHTRNN